MAPFTHISDSHLKDRCRTHRIFHVRANSTKSLAYDSSSGKIHECFLLPRCCVGFHGH